VSQLGGTRFGWRNPRAAPHARAQTSSPPDGKGRLSAELPNMPLAAFMALLGDHAASASDTKKTVTVTVRTRGAGSREATGGRQTAGPAGSGPAT
jgi:hypothetical protein